MKVQALISNGVLWFLLKRQQAEETVLGYKESGYIRFKQGDTLILLNNREPRDKTSCCNVNGGVITLFRYTNNFPSAYLAYDWIF
ncbi:hypothetical protein DPMN_188548 [Dreissena polymorpha]|uniref:Uncharacterized protein n=1 Tax=Dreissena polymorpha TaxID=45954 RepID=A0A9D4IBF7_DREPO|nr:hypothetical protein DPMN_188548 [Dreissena polymorpha]